MSFPEIIVITGVPDPETGDSGNMALDFDTYWETRDQGENQRPKVRRFIDVLIEIFDGDSGQAAGFMLNMRKPVFSVGEVLILDGFGREIGYPGRKPDKWDIDYEEVGTLEEAYTLAQKVMYPEKEAK